MVHRKRSPRATAPASEEVPPDPLSGGNARRPTVDEEEVLAQEAVPPGFAEDGLYRPYGFRCRQCSYRTKARGFSGRQAMRAHLKAHVHKRRAWSRPLLRCGIVVLLIAGLLSAALLGWRPLRPLWAPPVSLSWPLLGASLLSMAILCVATNGAEESMSKSALRLARGLVLLSLLFGALAAGTALGALGEPPGWPFFLPVGALLAACLLAAAGLGAAAYDASRGKRRSRWYAALFAPRDGQAVVFYEEWRHRVLHAVTQGKLKARKSTEAGRELLRVVLPRR